MPLDNPVHTDRARAEFFGTIASRYSTYPAFARVAPAWGMAGLRTWTC
jgi:hypothetical protein